MANQVEVRNIFTVVPNPRGPKGQKPAKQEFKKDADINSIMARFQKTGIIDHAAKYSLQYGDINPLSFHESMNVIARANTMFEELPSSARKRFGNSAADFLSFVQDEANYEEAQEMGLALSPEATLAAEARIEAEKAAAAASPPEAAAADAAPPE